MISNKKGRKKYTKPEITHTLIKQNGEIVSMKIEKTVVPIGSSAGIIVPKELLGKYVTITYNKEIGK